MIGLLLTLLACTGDPVDTSDEAVDPCFVDEPTLTIGSGEYKWEDLSEGDEVEMVHGPQGGWHMLGSARIAHTESVVRIRFNIWLKDSGLVISENAYTVQMIRDQDCSGFYPGMYGYINYKEFREDEDDTPPTMYGYQTVVMEMNATDLDNRTATTTLEVIAVPDPVDLKSDDTKKDGDTGSID